MSEMIPLADLMNMVADMGAFKATVARVHPDYDSVPKGTSTLVTGRELLDHLTARLAAAEADNDFARKEWAHWEAEACRIEKQRKDAEHAKALAEHFRTDRDAIAGIVERVRHMLLSALDEARNRAYYGCCGRAGVECCGEPVPSWSSADTAIMDTLAPIYRALTPTREGA